MLEDQSRPNIVFIQKNVYQLVVLFDHQLTKTHGFSNVKKAVRFLH